MKFFEWLAKAIKHKNSYDELRDFEVFARLSSYDLFLIGERLQEREFKAKEQLFEIDYPIEVIYFIKEGQIELDTADSDEGIIIGKGEALGFLDMFLGDVRTSSAKALCKVKAYALSKHDLLEYIDARPKSGNQMLFSLCKRFAVEIVKEREKQGR